MRLAGHFGIRVIEVLAQHGDGGGGLQITQRMCDAGAHPGMPVVQHGDHRRQPACLCHVAQGAGRFGAYRGIGVGQQRRHGGRRFRKTHLAQGPDGKAPRYW